MTTGDPIADKELERFEQEMQQIAARGMAGELNQSQLAAALEDAANRNMYTMLALGGADMQSDFIKKYITKNEKINKKSARKFARDIVRGRYNV